MEKEPIEITIAPAPASETATAKMKAKDSNVHEPGKTVGGISNYDQGNVDHASDGKQ